VGMYDQRNVGMAAWVMIGIVILIVLAAVFR
jgi:hypothetical protein